MPGAWIKIWTVTDNNIITNSSISCSTLKSLVICGGWKANLKCRIVQIRLTATHKRFNTRIGRWSKVGLQIEGRKEKLNADETWKYYYSLVSQHDQSEMFQSEVRNEEYRMTEQGSDSSFELAFCFLSYTLALLQLLKLWSVITSLLKRLSG